MCLVNMLIVDTIQKSYQWLHTGYQDKTDTEMQMLCLWAVWCKPPSLTCTNMEIWQQGFDPSFDSFCTINYIHSNINFHIRNTSEVSVNDTSWSIAWYFVGYPILKYEVNDAV